MKKTTILAISTGMLLFSGCASYKASPLNTLSPDRVYSLETESKDIFVSAKAFSKADCKKYLDRDVIKRGYQPIQIYIQNNSEKNYLFSLNRVSVSCARSEEVAEKVHTSTVGRSSGYGAAALIVWPMAIPAVIDGVKSANANEALDNDFSAKTARDQIIFNRSHFNKLIFVPVNEFQPTLSVTLIDTVSNESKTFNVMVN